jgi:hypothetical protein
MMAMDRYVWEAEWDGFWSADAGDGVVLWCEVREVEGEVRARLQVVLDPYEGPKWDSDWERDWPEIEKYLPRVEWPAEVDQGDPDERRPDYVLVEGIRQWRDERIAAQLDSSEADDGLWAWLGGDELAGGRISSEQFALLREASLRITQMIPEKDFTEEREQALNAATQYVLGEVTLEEVAEQERLAHYRWLHQIVISQGAMIAAHVSGVSATRIAEMTGLSRTTVHKRIGRK